MFSMGEIVYRADHGSGDDDLMYVRSDNGGRYVECQYIEGGVWVSHPRASLRRAWWAR